MKKAKEHAKKKRNAEEANVPVDQRVHEKITCDGCETSPIVGIRYKCAECPNFDLCSTCENNGVHEHHTFLKVKVPQGIEIHSAFRTENEGCRRRERKGCKKNEEGLKPLVEQVFEHQGVLDQLTQLGIDPQLAKDALIQHAGNFDLACSTASKEMHAKDEHPKEEMKEERPRGHCPWRGGRGRGRGRGGHKNPFKHMF